MLHLNSNDYGFDSQSLGFPSVMGCQALVLLTSQGLYGLHDLKTAWPESARLKVETWGTSVDNTFNLKGGGQKLKLYGVINNTQQYVDSTDGNNDWDDMLRHAAQALSFTGEICKYRINKHIDKKGSVYIRFDVAHNDTCLISYKRWSKMGSDDSDVFTSPNDYGFLRGQLGVNPQGTDVMATSYTSQAPGVFTNSVYRQGRTDEGNLNVVSAKKIVTL
jgi:hypothetical protein